MIEIISQFNSYFIKNVKALELISNNLHLNLFMYDKRDFNNKKIYIWFYYLISSIFLSGIKRSNLKTKILLTYIRTYFYNNA